MIGEMAGGLISGGLNYLGAQAANRANKKMAREQMAFQQESSREQMGFQERMSNTAYQRSMQDMRQAGLNPILAYNLGGASSPSGAQSAGATAQMQNELGSAVSSAQESRRLEYELKNMKKQNELLDAQTEQATSQSFVNNVEYNLGLDKQRQIQANTAKSLAETAKTKSDTIRNWVDTIGNNLNPVKFLNNIKFGKK